MNVRTNQTMALRQRFIDYYRKNSYKFLPPVKVNNVDPTLFFVNSGMTQLKDVISGKVDAKSGYEKLVNYQICIRAGGKHNDLDDVGFDSYHLTSFEMLGNWILKNASKEETIIMAYKFLTQELKLDPNRIYVTYFGGLEQLSPDLEAKEIWKQFVPSERIIPGSFKDNFWFMSEYGVCGNCSEIHYDLVGNRFVPELVNQGDPTVIEIWNLVFMQYDKLQDGNYNPLNKSVHDCGAGMERISMVLQQVPTLYQTDAFRYLIGYAQALTNGPIFKDLYGDLSDTAYRIFADHMRTVTIALHQGVKFDCHGREGVLRKIFRRLLTYSYLYLMNRTVRPIMSHPLIRSMITDILNYFLEKTHDGEGIWKQMIDEEHLYIGKLLPIRTKYNNLVKKYGDNLEKIREILRDQDGIGPEVVQNINSLKFEN